MKKLIIPFALFLLAITIFTACCNCGQQVSEENKVRGIIMMIGNEPFSNIGINDENNNNYSLICSKELKKELMNSQGKYYLIQFSEKKVVDGIPSLVVEKAIPIIQK